MATLVAKKRLLTVRINEQPIEAMAKETLLSAALRAGVDFPSSCRVGGCGTCKCRVTSGEVKELTETGYLLSAEEIDQGFVLACQSVPKGDVSIEVELGAEAGRRSVPGRVVGQTKVTHDITALRVKLETAFLRLANKISFPDNIHDRTLRPVVFYCLAHFKKNMGSPSRAAQMMKS